MGNEKFTCPICGEPTRVYMGNARKDRLCPKHADMLKAGELVLDENGKPCYPFSPNGIETSASDLTCIVCGENSNGKHFCFKCYHQYKDKVVLLKVHKCEFPTGEPLNEAYEGVYECEDGHIVKSIAEQIIDNWLSEKGIFHAYEAPLDIGEDKPLRPDFYLKNYLGEKKDVYVEYFGLKGQPKYDEQTKFKIKHYKKLGKTLVCLYPKDSKNLNYALETKLLKKEKIKEGKINYEE